MGNFKDTDENGLLRSLNGKLTGAHKVSCSAAEIACKSPTHSKIGQGMRIHVEKLVNWHGKNELIPVHFEQHFQFQADGGSTIEVDEEKVTADEEGARPPLPRIVVERNAAC